MIKRPVPGGFPDGEAGASAAFATLDTNAIRTLYTNHAATGRLSE
jgi:hypothetical protein